MQCRRPGRLGRNAALRRRRHARHGGTASDHSGREAVSGWRQAHHGAPAPSTTCRCPSTGRGDDAGSGITFNAGRRRGALVVLNTGDRPVQVGHHHHVFEVNPDLDFEREAAFGMRLDIAAGEAVRFEPGESRAVTIVAYGGDGAVSGCLVEGSLREARRRGLRVA